MWMMGNARWGAVWVVLSACSVELGYPADSRVVCRDDGDCRGETKCSVAAGVCIDRDDPDELPRITSATATDTSHVVLLFSAPMNPGELAQPSNYRVNPNLGVLGVDISADATRVTLTTTEQRARPYAVVTNALADIVGRPLASLEAPFEGIGDAVDESAPVLLVPLDATRLARREVTLVWTANPDAASYVVIIARDAALTDRVLTRDDVTESTLTTTLAADGTYFWSVSADVSDPSATSTFAVVEGGLHVHCADGASCNEDLSVFRGGDAAHPLVDTTYAIAVARALGVSTVRIARRRDDIDLPYTKALIVVGAGLAIEGGFDAAFATQDLSRPTTIAASATVLRLAQASGSTVRGLRLLGGAAKTAVLEASDTDALSLGDLVIRALVADAPTLQIDRVTAGSLVNVDVDGPVDQMAFAMGSEIVNSDLSIADSVFRTRGVILDGASDVTFVDSSIITTGATRSPSTIVSDQVYAFTLRRESRLHVLRSYLVSESIVDLNTVVIDSDDAAVVIESSRVYGGRTVSPPCGDGCGNTNRVLAMTTDSAAIADSLLAMNGQDGTAIDINAALGGVLRFVAVGSTFVAYDIGAPARVTLGIDPVVVDFVNNVFVRVEPDVVNCVLAPAGVPPSSMANNAFIGCSSPYEGFATVAALNAGGAHFGGNFAPAETLDALFPTRLGPDLAAATADDLYVPTTSGPLAGAGTSSTPCGLESSPEVCAAGATDVDGQARAAAPSVGAWEAR